jgi:uncharacterized protein YfaT (DUF1175 family)
MNKKEKKNLNALLDVCEQAVSYVGRANYDYRESFAQWNVRKAFDDFANDRTIKWTERGGKEA